MVKGAADMPVPRGSSLGQARLNFQMPDGRGSSYPLAVWKSALHPKVQTLESKAWDVNPKSQLSDPQFLPL